MTSSRQIRSSSDKPGASDSIEVITRYERGGTQSHSIDHGKTFHPTIKEDYK